jgi:putative inorganic carbon (hco3(-)) transporter
MRVKQFKLPGVDWLYDEVIGKKFNSVTGYIIMALMGLGVAYLTSEVDENLGIMIAAGMLALFLALVCIFNPEAGFYITIVVSTFISMPERLLNISLPVGLVIEAMSYVVFFSILAKQYRERTDTAAFWRNPVSIVMILQMGYFLIQVFNPEMHSFLGWFVFFRKQLSFMAFYYMSYIILNSYDKIIYFVKFWLAISLFIALWGIKQQWFGFFAFEEAWINADPQRVALFFQTGFMRKFSILTDPAGFGICMASMGVLCCLLGLRSDNRKNKIILLVAGLLMLLSTGYSGTRTANLMIAAGIAGYAVFTINEKRTFAFLAACVFGAVFLLYGPLQNTPVVFRIKTTLEGKKDASAVVRDVTRHTVQPYLMAHPLGAGVNTAGTTQYNPGHFMSTFQPDGGYMKIFMEQGIVGLLIHLISYFVILRYGVSKFYKAKNPQIKNLYISLTIFLFVLYVGELSQMTNGGYPYSFFFYPVLMILYKLIDYDNPEPEKSNN